MKQMTCPQMGGPAECTGVLKGNTPEEMIQDGTKHLAEAHPKMLDDMKAMPKEALEKWKAEFEEKWKATPDM